MEVEKIYFDMDGVLADFDRGVTELCGLEPMPQNIKPRNEQAEDHMWEEIRKVEHYYDLLEIVPGAKEMFDRLYERYGHRCEILTGIPKPRRGIVSAGDDKKAWVARLLSDRIKVNIVYSEEKYKYCTGPGCILIDDYDRNIRDWEAAGGTGILFTDAEDTIAQLIEKEVSV